MRCYTTYREVNPRTDWAMNHSRYSYNANYDYLSSTKQQNAYAAPHSTNVETTHLDAVAHPRLLRMKSGIFRSSIGTHKSRHDATLWFVTFSVGCKSGPWYWYPLANTVPMLWVSKGISLDSTSILFFGKQFVHIGMCLNDVLAPFWLRSTCFHSVKLQYKAFSRNFQRFHPIK
jgi:hypothetical protein